MGIEPGDLYFFLPRIFSVFGDTSGREMLELGNQQNRFGDRCAGKNFFRTLCFNHTMVDINGEDGSINKDLREPEQWTEWKERFDVVTNFGTTEHVEPNDKQWEAWKIIHDVTKPGGLMCHAIPMDTPKWAGHCSVYYSEGFFTSLAQACGYHHGGYTQVREHNVCVLQKVKSADFPVDRETILKWCILK